MICQKCGAECRDDAKFCNICGQTLESVQVEAATDNATNTATDNAVSSSPMPSPYGQQGATYYNQSDGAQYAQSTGNAYAQPIGNTYGQPTGNTYGQQPVGNPQPQSVAQYGQPTQAQTYGAMPMPQGSAYPSYSAQAPAPKQKNGAKIAIISIVSVLIIAGLVVGGIFLFKTLTGGGGVAGTYKFESMEYYGMTFTADSIKELSEAAGEDFDIGDFSLKLESNGDFTMSAMGNTVSGTYEVSGNKLTLTSNGYPVEGTIEGGTVTVEQSSMTIVFKK